MKTRLASPTALRLATACVLATLLSITLPLARAASLTWDQGGLSPGAPNSAAGTWDTTTNAYWSDIVANPGSPSDSVWNNSNKDTAVFGTGASNYIVAVQSGGVTVGGLTFSNTSGIITLSTGAITLSEAALGAGVTISAPSGSGNVTMASKLTGTANVSFSLGTFSFNLNTAADYVGTTLISGGGAMRLGIDNGLPTGTDLTVNGSFRLYGGKLQTVASLAGSGNITSYTSNAVFTVDGTTSTTFTGSLAINTTNTLSLVKAGTSTLTLTKTTSNYNGSTTVKGGTLSVSTLANGGNNSNIGASANTADKLILNGGTLKYTGAAVSTDRLFSLQSSSTIESSGSGALNLTNTGAMGFNSGIAAKTLALTGTNTGDNTLAALIADNTGATSLTKDGVGKWVLSGANTFTGPTTVSGGTLATDATGTFGAGDVSVAAGTSLTFGNNASIGDLKTLAFASTSTISLGFTGSETLGAVFNSVTSTFLTGGTYDASGLNTFFGVSSFSGTGSLTVAAIPEPSAYAALLGALVLGFAAFRRRSLRF
ncbi:MAG: autotransporter-associated beta strand repeat-containing protein [Opitutaceae bacterium]|jgi:fibronectin-binding autotransporter adhesin